MARQINITDVLEKLTECCSMVLQLEAAKTIEAKKIEAIIKEPCTPPAKQIAKPGSQVLIKLNVGGTVFVTTIATLTSPKAKGSYFDAMFSGRWKIDSCEDGTLFIDRDPTVFRYILNYLRGDIPDVNVLSISNRKDLSTEAAFYCLTDLVNSLIPVEPYFFFKAPNYKLEDNDKRAISTKEGFCAILGPEVKPDSTATIRMPLDHVNVMVGLAPPNIDLTHGRQYLQDGCGWYFYLIDQRLYGGSIGIGGKPYGCLSGTITPKATVGVKLHLNGDISFLINDTDYGTAYTIPTGSKYHLAVIAYDQHSVIELV